MKEKLTRLKKSPSFSGMILFIVLLVVYFIVQYIQDPNTFFTIKTYKNFASLFKSYSPLILVTMGQALLMLMGIIDISIGMQMSFANVLAVMLPTLIDIPVPMAWALALLATVAVSTLNGVIVSYLRIPPLLAGFAMIYVVKGVNLLISPKPGGKVPVIANKIYDSMIFGLIPFSLIILMLCYLLWMYMQRTPLLKHVYAIGGNERNAYATGINSAATKVKMYAIAGAFTGLAGLCYTAAYTTGNPITGEIYGLQSISACILGGISMAGGWGTMACAIFGIGFQLLVQTSVPKVFSMISKLTGVTYNTYWHNLLSDSIILIGLVATIFTVKAQRTTLIKGLKKQVKGGMADE
ncbi:ABC transporter permease [Oscillospiraceae bacterium PP1C4]